MDAHGAEHLVPGVVERCDDESAQKRERIRAELPRRDGAGDARFGGVSTVVVFEPSRNPC